MKLYTNIITTGIAITLISFFAVTQVSAHDKSTDFYAGQKAGAAQVLNDTNFTDSALNFANIEHEAREASGTYVGKLKNAEKSDDYVIGFRTGYEKAWLLRVAIESGE